MSKPEGGDKKPQTAPTQSHSTSEPKVSKGKGHTPMPDGCHSWGCKGGAKKFNFCMEHYEQFKFGLIKKTGEPVSDYEKKFEHYENYKKKIAAHKVA